MHSNAQGGGLGRFDERSTRIGGAPQIRPKSDEDMMDGREVVDYVLVRNSRPLWAVEPLSRIIGEFEVV